MSLIFVCREHRFAHCIMNICRSKSSAWWSKGCARFFCNPASRKVVSCWKKGPIVCFFMQLLFALDHLPFNFNAQKSNHPNFLTKPKFQVVMWFIKFFFLNLFLCYWDMIVCCLRSVLLSPGKIETLLNRRETEEARLWVKTRI